VADYVVLDALTREGFASDRAGVETGQKRDGAIAGAKRRTSSLRRLKTV
jgi:hypothetical protein